MDSLVLAEYCHKGQILWVVIRTAVIPMTVFYVVDYFLKYEKTGEYVALIKSEKGRKMFAAIEKETGARFRGMYFPVMGFGEYTAEDWWEFPNHGTLDKFRDSKAWHKALRILNEFYDTKPFKARLMGSIEHVKVVGLRGKKRK